MVVVLLVVVVDSDEVATVLPEAVIAVDSEDEAEVVMRHTKVMGLGSVEARVCHSRQRVTSSGWELLL